MTKEQTRKTLSELTQKIDETFKKSDHFLFTELQRDYPGVTVPTAVKGELTRDEMLSVLIKGMIYAAFDPDVKRAPK